MAHLQASILFKQNYYTDSPVVVNQGGTSSGKTYAIEQVLFSLACSGRKLVITIVGQDIPNLKSGALRDALNIYHSSVVLQQMVKTFNRTDRIFEFYNGTAKYTGANGEQGEFVVPNTLKREQRTKRTSKYQTPNHEF